MTKMFINEIHYGKMMEFYYQKHTIRAFVYISIFIILFLYFISLGKEPQPQTQQQNLNQASPESVNVPSPQIAPKNIDIDILYLDLFGKNSQLTSLQKKEAFNKIKDSYIQSVGRVKDVNGDGNEYTLTLLCVGACTEFDINLATLYFSQDEKEKLRGLKTGEWIEFTGRMDSQYNLRDGFLIYDAKIIKTNVY